MDEYLSTRQVVELLDIQEWQIENAIRRRDIPRPPVVGGTRIWTWDLVERLADSLAAVTPAGAQPTASTR